MVINPIACSHRAVFWFFLLFALRCLSNRCAMRAWLTDWCWLTIDHSIAQSTLWLSLSSLLVIRHTQAHLYGTHLLLLLLVQVQMVVIVVVVLKTPPRSITTVEFSGGGGGDGTISLASHLSKLLLMMLTMPVLNRWATEIRISNDLFCELSIPFDDHIAPSLSLSFVAGLCHQ